MISDTKSNLSEELKPILAAHEEIMFLREQLKNAEGKFLLLLEQITK